MRAGGEQPSRRGLLKAAAVGGAIVGLLTHALAWARSLVPNVLYEPPTRRRLGPAERFPDGHTYLPDDKIFVIRKDGRIRAVSAICTHLGCTVGTKGEGYHCPCHGSTFSADGTATGGPAPRALPWHPIELGGGGELIVDLGREVGADEALVIAASDADTSGEGSKARGAPK